MKLHLQTVNAENGHLVLPTTIPNQFEGQQWTASLKLSKQEAQLLGALQGQGQGKVQIKRKEDGSLKCKLRFKAKRSHSRTRIGSAFSIPEEVPEIVRAKSLGYLIGGARDVIEEENLEHSELSISRAGSNSPTSPLDSLCTRDIDLGLRKFYHHDTTKSGRTENKEVLGSGSQQLSRQREILEDVTSRTIRNLEQQRDTGVIGSAQHWRSQLSSKSSVQQDLTYLQPNSTKSERNYQFRENNIPSRIREEVVSPIVSAEVDSVWKKPTVVLIPW
eukprot:TRINITY_DN3207_c0_g1_i2.p2 TRINITY_DN3207_c0_g1~~TRINITY_DN3207_c0_g1_i2.p2  ORF type:complete len:275 (+),score=30.95 TRINITY_DN3207_c0_g1_i2:264-1088(+)